jgi:hypothetical protein
VHSEVNKINIMPLDVNRFLLMLEIIQYLDEIYIKYANKARKTYNTHNATIALS